MKTNLVLVPVSVALLLLPACTTNPFTGQTQVSNTVSGGLIGAGAGAIGGALIGSTMGDPRAGALIGAGIGALAGGAVGNYMDRQDAMLRAQLQGTGISVTRVGNNIILNMPSNITFGVSQFDIDPQFQSKLRSVALVLQEFNQTLVDIVGHTDSTGSRAYNMQLSQNRATAVSRSLAQFGVDPRRFFVTGQGPDAPVADNATEAGRALNRRVEIRIVPLSAG
jgi:outer membrane protein OmpA-like peptidoglycan-associated protein